MSEQFLASQSSLTFLGVLIFSTGFAAGIGMFLIRRAVFAPLGQLSRVMRAALRFLGLKSIARTRSARAAITGATAHRRGDHLTAIECALRCHEAAEEEAVGEYDFAEEKRILKKQGTFFTQLIFPAQYIPESLSKPFSEAISDQYDSCAQEFFGRNVDLRSDEMNLYDDEEGAVIVGLFRRSDRRGFYALDRMRRVINRNARQLVSLISILTLAAAVVIYFVASRFAPAGASAGTEKMPVLIGAVLAALVIFYGTAGFIHMLYNNGQRQNMREFSNFLTRYLSLISNRFREASAAASRVIQGDERDSKRLAANSQKWHRIMIWLGLRPFFFESFIRNVIFQIRRNSKYYVGLGLFLILTLGPALFFGVALALSEVGIIAGLSMAGWAAVLVVYVGCALLGIYFINKPVIFDELSQANWLGYDNLEVGRQMDEVIGKYAEEIGLWRGRFRE